MLNVRKVLYDYADKSDKIVTAQLPWVNAAVLSSVTDHAGVVGKYGLSSLHVQEALQRINIPSVARALYKMGEAMTNSYYFGDRRGERAALERAENLGLPWFEQEANKVIETIRDLSAIGLSQETVVDRLLRGGTFGLHAVVACSPVIDMLAKYSLRRDSGMNSPYKFREHVRNSMINMIIMRGLEKDCMAAARDRPRYESPGLDTMGGIDLLNPEDDKDDGLKS